jgi:WD40 repeat protein
MVRAGGIDNMARARGVLERAAPEDREFEWHLLMRLAQGAGRSALTDMPDGVAHAALDPTGTQAAVVTPRTGRTVALWYFKDRSSEVIGGLGKEVSAVAFSPSGDALAAAGTDGDGTGHLKVWRLGMRREDLLSEHRTSDMAMTGLAFRPDGQAVAAVTWNSEVKLYPARGRGTPDLVSGRRFVAGQPRAVVAWLDNNRLVHGASDSSDLRLVETAARRVQVQFQTAAGTAALATHRGSALVAAAGTDRAVRIFTSSGPRARWTLSLDAQPRQLAFSPNGRRLAVALDGGSVELYALTGERWLRVYSFAADGTSGLSFSSGGETLLTAGGRVVAIWGRLPGE